MSKKAYCNNNPAIAYYSGFSGLEIHGIEYGIDDYIYIYILYFRGLGRQ